MSTGAPLTLGTAGHVDHGKTALVAALTGVDTDRLPEEKARGLTIVLGYAPLELPSGRRMSVVDVPGHERFVRTMVAGASGIDCFLMTIAADDGVMPQTLEHAEVLSALGVETGVVAVTKCELADPAAATAQAAELFGDVPVIACSARTGTGLEELLRALEELASAIESRATLGGPVRLHVDRVFTVTGRGTVATGTLWSGAIAAGDSLELLPAGASVRVRAVEVHGAPVSRAPAGQRVAVNLTGARARDVRRGDVLAAPGTLGDSLILDCDLRLREAHHGERVQVLHGTRSVSGRLLCLEGSLWQLRLEQPLLALEGDRLVVRRLAPPDTLGGGVVLDARARRHGRRREILERLRCLRDGEPLPPSAAKADGAIEAPATRPARGLPAVSEGDLLALEQRLRDAGPALLSESQLTAQLPALRVLRDAGRAVRVSGRLYGDVRVVAAIRERIVALIEREGTVTLARVRDALGISRKSAQAFLEYLDGQQVTRRLPDDRREPARRRRARQGVR